MSEITKPDTTGLITIATTSCEGGDCPKFLRDPARPGWVGILGYTRPGQPSEAIVWHLESDLRDLAAQLPPL